MITCAVHETLMERDEPRCRWKCTAPGCPAYLDDEELRELKAENPGVTAFNVGPPPAGTLRSRRMK